MTARSSCFSTTLIGSDRAGCVAGMRTLRPMPELPDVIVYVECLERRITGETLASVRLASPFLLRTFDPPVMETYGKVVVGVERIGKRIVIALSEDLFLVVHLMIAGRLRWRKPGAKPPGKQGLAAFDFADGTVMFRHAQVLFPDAAAAPYETLIDLALTECERYYPAFQFVIWGGKPAAEAIAAALLDTQGEA